MLAKVERNVSQLEFSDSGKSLGVYEHWSAPNRYQVIIDLLTLPPSRLSPTLMMMRQKLEREELHIYDCAAGNGQAIVGLAQALIKLDKKVQVTVSDLLNPKEIVFSQYRRDFAQIVTNSEIFDATMPPRNSRHFDLTIMGYLHPYLTVSDMQSAIKNRLAESTVLAIIPAGNKPLSPLSCQFFMRQEDEIVTALLDSQRRR